MKNLFISENDEITIKFVLAETKTGKLLAENSKEVLNAVHDDLVNQSTIEEHEVVFRRPSFGDLVKLTGNINLDSSASVNFNPFAIRSIRMSNLIKRWTLLDEDGKTKAATAETVAKLNPIIANVIGSQLETELGNV